MYTYYTYVFTQDEIGVMVTAGCHIILRVMMLKGVNDVVKMGRSVVFFLKFLGH